MKHRATNRLTAAALLLALATTFPAHGAKESVGKAELAALEQKTFSLTNGYRKQKGLSVLEWNDALAKIARGHSRDMAGREALDHGGFDKRKKAIMKALPYQSMAENIFRTTRALDEVAGAALDSWVHSKAHRKNLEGDFVVSGMGAARGADGRIYLTQLFVTEQGPEFDR
jgi:uncharacterized protein YkwD